MKELKGIDNNTAIHCPTEELAKQVCKILHEAGKMWIDGDTYLQKTLWVSDQTIYYLDGTCGHLLIAKRHGYKILPASEFIKLNSTEIPDTSIPENWCIRRTLENAKVLNAWVYWKTGDKLFDSDMYINNNACLIFGIDHTEITFQQWCILNKSWLEGEGREVWKEYQKEKIKELAEEEKTEFLVGRYVKLIKRNGLAAENGAIGIITRSPYKSDYSTLIDVKWISGSNGQQDGGYSLHHYADINSKYFELLPEDFKPETFQKKIKALSSDFVFDLKFVSDNDFVNPETRKIIGYKAPFDMFDGNIKKGDLVAKSEVYVDCLYWDSEENNYLPAEWVEKDWEPVYEEKTIWEKYPTWDSLPIEHKHTWDISGPSCEKASSFLMLSAIAQVWNEGWSHNYKTINQDPGYTIERHHAGCSRNESLSIAPVYTKSAHIVFKTKELAEKSKEIHSELWNKFYEL